MFTGCAALTTVYVKNSTEKTWFDARLTSAGLSVRSTIK
jgi:hypothetical protein